MFDIRQCAKCNLQVAWVRTVAGNAIPIDPFPVDGGELIVIGGVAQPPLGEVLEGIYGPERYASHVRTCSAWAKRKDKVKS